MKNNNGVTLLELILAISMLTLILFAGSSIYLSGMNLSADARYSTQAHRNAQIVIMHIEKYVRDAASEFIISPDQKTLNFKTYNIDSPDFSHAPSIIIQYAFNPVNKQMIFTSGDDEVIFEHINDCLFNIGQNDGVVLEVTIWVDDNINSGKNIYRLNTHMEACVTASPAVY